MKSIIEYAFALTEAVERLRERARQYFYQVVLSGHPCPNCLGELEMLRENRCRCLSCNLEFDPTLAFQRCSTCGGKPELAIRRYRCRSCGEDIQSRFLFDGLVFDAEYFRQKMTESRQGKQERRERVRKMLAESRSGLADVPAADLDTMPGLTEVLNALTQGSEAGLNLPPATGFSLKRYQNHIQAHLRPFPVSLGEIPPLGEDAREDLVWRFIAIVFLDHAGIIEIWQDGQEIMVMQRETHSEGQGVPADLEAAA